MTTAHEEYTADQGREQYIRDMTAKGYRIVYPNVNELQIDLDSEAEFEHFIKQWQSFLREYPKAYYALKPSRNGLPGRHVTITLPFYVTELERITWQAVLGSDLFREFMSMIRYKRGDLFPTLFVEHKEKE